MQTETKTTCPYCGVGCGVIVSRDDEGAFQVKGDPQHPANYGLLCSKGSALAETLSLDGRLLEPVVNGKPVEWEQALDAAATGLQRVINEHGADAVAFYVSGQLLTEDYYVANKLMKGFIGSGNIDTNSRLCMSSAVAGYKRAFGSDTVPCCYEDLERAKLLVIVGSNTAWCHPVIYQRIARAKKENPDLFVVLIDPRKTATANIADQFLSLKAGTDQVLYNGLFKYILEQGEEDRSYIELHTEGLDDIAIDALPSLEEVAEQCGLSLKQVESFYRLFTRTDRVVTLYSQGINQWSYGTDRVNAIINVHLLSGRIGKPGMGPFSITGQPNAMGGREVGGLSNQLAAHMDIKNPQHHQWVSDFWQAPSLTKEEGLKAVDLFDAIHQGKIRAVWIMATNPAVSLPQASRVREALQKCELVIVSDCVEKTDTTRYADILLPAQTWGERDGTVTNSERCISRQRPFLNVQHGARPDWWIISQVAQHMGYQQAFDYQSAHQVFSEHAELSGLHNQGSRDFDISGLATMDTQAYDQLAPVQWPVTTQQPAGSRRLFEDGQFFTPSGKANFIFVPAHTAATQTSTEFPLVLNTGRVRDHWHTMTRTAKSPRLSTHIREPYVDIHPDDIARFNIKIDGLLRMRSRNGEVIVRARSSEQQQVGSVFMPIHWNDHYSAQACVDTLVSANTDPVSGQPEFKYTPVSIMPFEAAYFGYVITRRELPQIRMFDYWTRIQCQDMVCYEVASCQPVSDWTQEARKLLCADAESPEWIEYYDMAPGRYRAARLESGRLDSCLFIAPDGQLPDKSWLMALFSQSPLADTDRMNLLAGSSGSPQLDKGDIVCSCFSVGINTIRQAIQEQNLVSVEAIGEYLRAGTNCGSCKPELQNIIDDVLNPQPVMRVIK